MRAGLSESPMKIAIMSDLHLEFDAGEIQGGRAKSDSAFYAHPPETKADVLVLAGNIHRGAQGVAWADRHFTSPVVLIGGNCEPYGHELFRVIAYNRQKANATSGHVKFLERATWTFRAESGEQARFVGTTLWTDFRLYGTPEASMEIARQRLEDYRLIKVERGYKQRLLDPSDIVRLYAASVAFLRKELSRPFDGVTVVVTHHAPSRGSIAPGFQEDLLNPAFASDLEAVIRAHAPPLWIHGHMRDSFDYMIGKTRVVCNPRGYFPDKLNPSFDPRLAVEIFPEQRPRARA